MTPEVSASSAVLAMNQGLYNGFLAAGLVWGLALDSRVTACDHARREPTRFDRALDVVVAVPLRGGFVDRAFAA